MSKIEADPFTAIVQFLNGSGIEHGVIEHEPVHTSQEAATVRGVSMSQGAKSLLLKTEDEFVVTVIQGDRRLDIKKLMSHIETGKRPRFARPEEVEEQMGCEIGACYPLAQIAGLRTVIDAAFLEQESMSFNPGVHNKTIVMDVADFVFALNPEVADLVTD